MSFHEEFAPFLDTEELWIICVLLFFSLCLILEEIIYQHRHPLCLICLLEGLLYQKLYDPLCVVLEEYIYLPLCLIMEELFEACYDPLGVMFQ
ncbi:hypothetical protein Mp_4g03910 [Marchantia polymorpha subsp. ruderalis]|uniref:Uncharacterized protein n=2 Tax=Marchantia polymorpha TaxID=3197 RepID=A0AAF6B624_MARPO|nr:hypothetical protein MARPO_0044s0083 [Marchantia polymorpha]BBN07458.1 hypothetical protein Mp_4g03910 [Marchantia polymorpha subsp. ruderalis]|eukprot:PTQ39643.1 hypothetical protein MARPO_0044s0083 [Marchantia polymorpha]